MQMGQMHYLPLAPGFFAILIGFFLLVLILRSVRYAYESLGGQFKCCGSFAPCHVNRQLICLSCGGPLHGREGRFLLKFFLTERPKRRAGKR